MSDDDTTRRADAPEATGASMGDDATKESSDAIVHDAPAPVKLDGKLSAAHLAMLRDGSGISDAVILARGYRTITDPADLAAFPKNQRRAPGLLIPLHTTDGQVLEIVYRPDNPRVREDKRKGKLKDGTWPCTVIKYEFPKGQRTRLDCPPACRPALGNPAIPLWITEGQKKGDALASRGACAIALLGVWNWRGKNELGGNVVLADFDYIALNGRDVRIVFDSDVMTKSAVRTALARFTEHLQRKGATVTSVYLPAGPGGKVGVDDYLAAGGTLDTLETLAETPRPAPQAAPPRAEILDCAPLTMRRPLALIDGVAYAATWLYVRLTITETVNKAGEIVAHNPPIVEKRRMLVIVRSDGQCFGDFDAPGLLPLSELGFDVALPEIPPGEKLWSVPGMKRYLAGNRPDPVGLFGQVVDVVDRFIDFNRSLADQRTMAEFVACYILATWGLDAVNVIGFLWPNGDRGSGKTQLLMLVCELAYLGQVILAGGSYASLRDLADYGATLAFDDAENLADPRKTDPDKRTLLLAGNRRGSVVSLKEQAPDKTWRTRYVDAFCPRLFSAIEAPDPVLASRAIVVPLIRTLDKDKGNADPLDAKKWPHDRDALRDDLWALGLRMLPELGDCEELACGLARIAGRPLEPWRAVLAVALWLQTKGAAGLFDRIEALSWAYQTERADLEKADLTALVLQALVKMFVDPAPCTTCITCTTCTTTTGDTPLLLQKWPFSAKDIRAAILETFADENGDPEEAALDAADAATQGGKKGGREPWPSVFQVGKVLGKLRFRREQQTTTKKRRSWYWIVGADELARRASSYGIAIPDALSLSLTSGASGASGACGASDPGREVIDL